jgi:hypothetical protein
VHEDVNAATEPAPYSIKRIPVQGAAGSAGSKTRNIFQQITVDVVCDCGRSRSFTI